MVHPARQELLADKHAAYIVAFSQARSCRRSLAAAAARSPPPTDTRPLPAAGSPAPTSSSAPALPPLATHS